jgi:hypothetical protein
MTDDHLRDWTNLELADHLRACQSYARELDDLSRAEPPGARVRSLRISARNVRARGKRYREELERRGVDPEWLPV